MYAVAASLRAHYDEQISRRIGSGGHDYPAFDYADAHHVDKRVVVVGEIEHYLTADVWHSDAIAVVGYPRNDTGH